MANREVQELDGLQISIGQDGDGFVVSPLEMAEANMITTEVLPGHESSFPFKEYLFEKYGRKFKAMSMHGMIAGMSPEKMCELTGFWIDKATLEVIILRGPEGISTHELERVVSCFRSRFENKG